MDLTKHKPVEEVIEKFKGFKVNPLEVMIALPKIKSKIVLDAKASNDRSLEMVKNGITIINKGKKVEDWEIGEKVQVSNDGVQMSVVYDHLDADYNIMLLQHYHIKFAFPEGYEIENIKNN